MEGSASSSCQNLKGNNLRWLRFVLNVKTFLEDVFLFFFTAGWLLVCSVPYGFCLFLRWSVVVYLKLRYGFLSSLVSGLDAIGTDDSPSSRQIIKSLKILKGDCDIEDLRRRCLATVGKRDDKGNLVYPKFYQFLDTCVGFYCWKPSNFDINHHVRICDVLNMDSEEESMSESQALELTSKLSNEPFEKNRANWEILVIPRFHYDKEEESKDRVNKFAIIIRISHGIGDGFSLMKLILRDMGGDNQAAENCIPIPKRRETSWLYKIAVFSYVFFRSPRTFYFEMLMRDKSPLHNDNVKMTGEKIVIWSEPINVEWLKNTKNKMGVGMSTILLGALIGAFRKYIMEEKKVAEEDLPSHMSALIPMPAPNHPDNTMCNKFSAVMFQMESKSSNPIERCKAIDKAGREMASSPDAPVNLFLMNLIGVAPLIINRFFIYNSQTTVVVSNIPGPGKPINIWGRQLLDTMFWLPNVGDSGLSVSFLSYKSHLRIGLTVDTGVISDGYKGAKKLIHWMQEELHTMANISHVPAENFVIDIVKESWLAESNDTNNSSLETSNVVSQPENYLQDLEDKDEENEKLNSSSDLNQKHLYKSESPEVSKPKKIEFNAEESVLKSRHCSAPGYKEIC